jgi:single-strand DNA-binding protein
VDRRRLPGGTTLVNFRVASNERRFDRAKATWIDGEALYLPVTAWRKLAENVHASFVVGDPIIVRGRLFSRGYDKDGRRHSVITLEATAVGPDLTRSTASVTRTGRADAGGPGRRSAAGAGDDPNADAERDDPWSTGGDGSGGPGPDVAGVAEPCPATSDGSERAPGIEAAVGS